MSSEFYVALQNGPYGRMFAKRACRSEIVQQFPPSYRSPQVPSYKLGPSAVRATREENNSGFEVCMLGA